MSWQLNARQLALVLIGVVSAGCYSTGAKAIRAGRGNYNVAIQQTNAQQLLLNLVRLRYRDTPAFLVVSSVSTSFTVAVDAGGAIADVGELGVVGLSGGLAFAEKPSITYLPLQGEQFVQLLMSPMELRVPHLLYHSGWRIDRILRVCLQNLGKLPNAPSAASPTPSLAPEYEQFTRVAKLLRDLQVEGQLQLIAQMSADGDTVEAIVLQIDSRADVQELMQLLELPPDSTEITLTTETMPGTGTIAVVTRSVMSTMFFLSVGVEPPARDERAGRVTVTRYPNGDRFDWRNVTGDLLIIKSSDSKPEKAYTGLSYRGSWFYIDDNHLDSKSTFTLLAQLMALQAGDIKLTGPVLTLPVR